jgi:hypothetical protein
MPRGSLNLVRPFALVRKRPLGLLADTTMNLQERPICQGDRKHPVFGSLWEAAPPSRPFAGRRSSGSTGLAISAGIK